MKKQAHFLNPTSGENRPQNIIFVDTETQTQKLDFDKVLHTLKLGVAMYYRYDLDGGLRYQREIHFYDTMSFAVWMTTCTRPKTVTYLVMHNVDFDLPVLNAFSDWITLGWELVSFYSVQQVAIYRWQRGKAKLVVLDNGNFFRGSLATLANIVDLPKLEIDFMATEDQELLTYCRRDVEILVKLWELWLSFLDDHDLGNFRMTLASTAFSAYRRRFMDHKIYIHANQSVLNLERASYRGGRVQPLWIGHRDDGPFYHVDINSMYPSVMRDNFYPVSLYGVYERDNLDYLKAKIENYCVIADVTLNTDLTPYGLVREGFLLFPKGTFRIQLTTPELEFALRHNHIKAVHKFVWYQPQAIFQTYVNYFYNLRLAYKEEGNHPLQYLCKILLNSLYGKFGQWNYQQAVVGEVDHDRIERSYYYEVPTNTHYILTALAGKVFQSGKVGEAYHSYPAIASHVTAYGRMLLFYFMQKAGNRNVFYVDTDSLIINQAGFDNLSGDIDNTRLGALKLESTSDWCEIRARKDYSYHQKHVKKGIRKDAIEVESDTYQQDQFASILGMIRYGRLDGVIVSKITKKLNYSLSGGSVAPDGWIDWYCLTD